MDKCWVKVYNVDGVVCEKAWLQNDYIFFDESTGKECGWRAEEYEDNIHKLKKGWGIDTTDYESLEKIKKLPKDLFDEFELLDNIQKYKVLGGVLHDSIKSKDYDSLFLSNLLTDTMHDITGSLADYNEED